MRRLPLVASFVLFIVLCASIAYWGLQLFKPPLRPVAAPPRSTPPEVRPEAAAALFGGRGGNVAVASNYQLKGVIFSDSPRDSIAILGVDGKPAQAIRNNSEVVPGVTVKEVHRDYVLLSEGGATKRVELPESAKGQVNLATSSPVNMQPAPMPPSMPVPAMVQPPPIAGTQPPPMSAMPSQPLPGKSGIAPPPTTAVNPPMAQPPQ